MKNICYPVFLEASLYSEDSFWKFVFRDLAFGTCPYGTFIDNDAIQCRFKGKEFHYEIQNKNPMNVLDDLVTIFKEKLDLRSTIDIAKRYDYIHEYLDEMQPRWDEIKKKAIRHILIENYVLKMRKEFGLNLKQSKKLLSNILIGFQFKLLTKSDVEYDYKRYEINHIEGIEVSREKQVVPTFKDEYFSELDPIVEFEKIPLRK